MNSSVINPSTFCFVPLGYKKKNNKTGNKYLRLVPILSSSESHESGKSEKCDEKTSGWSPTGATGLLQRRR